MSIIKTAAGLQDWLNTSDRRNKTLGFVPTMGSLHEGHLSLVRQAREENDLVIVSVFVNPMQFAKGDDFKSYPRDIERDHQLAGAAGADVVFYPSAEEIYVPGCSTTVEVDGEISMKLCGESRPGHFRGVTTVVSILFNITGPDAAYFGQKDAQQALIIKKMVKDLHMPLKIKVCETVREKDGLAMSSRNVYLDPDERRAAAVLNSALEKAQDDLRSGRANCCDTECLRQLIEDEISKEPLADIDYVHVLDAETLEDMSAVMPERPAVAAVAVRIGKTRLIDNRILALK